jgi:hypothetical protein
VNIGSSASRTCAEAANRLGANVFTVPEIIAAAPRILVGFGDGLAGVNTLDAVGVQPILVSTLQQNTRTNVSAIHCCCNPERRATNFETYFESIPAPWGVRQRSQCRTGANNLVQGRLGHATRSNAGVVAPPIADIS